MKLNKQRLLSWSKEIGITFLLIIVLSNTFSYLRSPEIKDKTLPQINALLINQELYSTTVIEDKPLLIHFWATWCPTCKLEADNIQRISKDYDVLTIAVKSGSDDDLNEYMQEHSFDYKVINDHNGKLSSRFNVSAFPTTFIYNKDKELTFSEVGYTSYLGLYLRMIWATW